MRSAALAAALLAAMQMPALAEDTYIDDRSTPEALLRSLYNAINRKEYARAFDYFSTPPAKSLEAYQEGYADTESVDLLTGPATSEGAAGSIYYSLPVAIRATAADGGERVFAGCYTLRLANPAIQGTPYQPLHVEKAAMKPAEGDLPDVLPPSCGEGQAVAGDTVLAEAEALFAAAYGRSCTPPQDEAEPQSYTIPFNYSYDDEDAPKREARLFRFFCSRGAYNETHVYLLADAEGAVTPLQFATPETDIQYENGDTEGKVEDIRVIGYTAQDKLVNSDFDPDTLTLFSHAKWRGVGDASSTGTWIFREGTFTLVRYDVDASYNGEIDPVTLLDYNTGP
ncbi:DUF1176 domain-containing protein [Nitratireductor sp. ZSWI3]|uniref:DUF1176 domain-containing protein n=1 Tax=Nitratireductor sp. ZSWI3 TaxID=2966359 RepID=UPI00214FA2DC|nr:DUF1176 domain-containing protein [Nitratireductor sp. ZSWI3]MCR4266254.1 DUF1176 domain-containing protein [Nitratireductor sp. ZSWI3]